MRVQKGFPVVFAALLLSAVAVPQARAGLMLGDATNFAGGILTIPVKVPVAVPMPESSSVGLLLTVLAGLGAALFLKSRLSGQRRRG
jgi:hypothetical protein